MQIEKLNNSSDSAIIERVLNGETDLYEVIMRRYNQRLFRVGRSFFGNNNDEIEDLMQFTYIRAYEKLSSFENRSAFSTWLTRIFINEAIARKKYNSRFVENNEEPESVHPYYKESNGMKNPYTITANKELKDLLEKAISDLPEKYKLVFVMHEVEQLSIHETGECLNITEINVKVRLNRARKMLRENLSAFYKPEDLFSFNLKRCDVIVDKVLSYIINNKSQVS